MFFEQFYARPHSHMDGKSCQKAIFYVYEYKNLNLSDQWLFLTQKMIFLGEKTTLLYKL